MKLGKKWVRQKNPKLQYLENHSLFLNLFSERSPVDNACQFLVARENSCRARKRRGDSRFAGPRISSIPFPSDRANRAYGWRGNEGRAFVAAVSAIRHPRRERARPRSERTSSEKNAGGNRRDGGIASAVAGFAANGGWIRRDFGKEDGGARRESGRLAFLPVGRGGRRGGCAEAAAPSAAPPTPPARG